ncbi:MAG: polymer-forming cytoskeletal protein [Vicinamibacterales bacterium]
MTRIGPSISIRGEITSDENLRLDGRIDGRVLVRNAELRLGPEARADGDLRGARVLIEGQARGPVTATERIELAATAAVEGSLSADYIVIADGARFNGRIDMDRRTIAARVEQYRGMQARPPAP